eukprot:scaffold1145_cov77-Skeletonema_dohrnii-CCMP3373.AAC.5
MARPKALILRRMYQEHPDIFRHAFKENRELYIGRPHSPATAATWVRYLLNPAISHTPRQRLFISL